MKFRLIRLIVMVVLVFPTAGSLAGKDYFVDQKHPQADDKNPGTEDKPYKTIQAAVNLVGPGETVFVKAGRYEDLVTLSGYGKPGAPKTLTAWKDDRVVIGSRLCELPAADRWKPVPGHKSWQVQLDEGAPADLIVILDGRAIVTQFKDEPPADDKLNWATYRRGDRTLMVNTGDGNPAAVHKLQRARHFEPFRTSDSLGYWEIKKLEFAWSNSGASIDGTGMLLEDCYFHDIYRPGLFCIGRLCTIRRCNFRRCGYGIAGGGVHSIIEDCLFVQCGQESSEDIDSRTLNVDEGGGPVLCKGRSTGMIFRYNILADNKGGLWYDGVTSGVRIIGNAFWSNQWGNGLYNEFGVNDTLVLGNYFYETSVNSSWSTRMSVIDNFFDVGRMSQGGGVGWYNRDVAPLRYGHMVLRGNAVVGTHMGYICGSDHGTTGMWPEGFARAMVDYNRVRVLANDTVLFTPGYALKTLTEVQNRFGWDLHGEVKVFDRRHNDLTPEAMGGSTVTFRVPWGPRSHLVRPMLADAKIDGRWPQVPEYAGDRMPAFFWRVASGNYDPNDLTRWRGYDYEAAWQPDCDAGYDLGDNRGATWYVGAEDRYPDPKFSNPPANRASQSSGNRWLVMQCVKPEKMPLSGVGWWTPWLATAPGAKTTVSLKIYGKGVNPTEKCAPAVYVQFIGPTGQQMTRAFIIGRDARGVLHRPELTKGSYPWTEVSETVTAPETAVRMALFLGIQPCKGELGFDDINLKTADGEKWPSEVELSEALPARIARERLREIVYLDLSKVADRALADDTAGDGRGWTNQGPELDMRRLKTGQQSLGGVPFRILDAAKAAVVLRGNGKAGADLPQEVVIPVGRKLEALYILHASAFMDQPKDPPQGCLFDVTVKFADGTTSTWQAWPRVLADWLAPAVREFIDDYPPTQTTAALSVPVGKSAHGTIYRTEWIFDRPKHVVPIQSITLRGTQRGVGIILGLTGITQW